MLLNLFKAKVVASQNSREIMKAPGWQQQIITHLNSYFSLSLLYLSNYN